MRLLSRKKVKSAADGAPRQDEGVAPSSTLSPADDLVDLKKLAEWKQNLKRLEADYKRGQIALVTARRLVAGTDPLPQPDLTWHMHRELLVAAGDATAVVQLDVEHLHDLADKLAARQHAHQARSEAETKVKALTQHLNDIAKQMAALADGDLYRSEAKRLFKPSAQRMAAAAKEFSKAHREMVAIDCTMRGICRMHQRHVDGKAHRAIYLGVDREGRERQMPFEFHLRHCVRGAQRPQSRASTR